MAENNEIDEIKHIIEIALAEAIEAAVKRAEERAKQETYDSIRRLTGINPTNEDDYRKIRDTFEFAQGVMNNTRKVQEIGFKTAVTAIIIALLSAFWTGIKSGFIK